MAIGLKEKAQILETFGSSNVSFFGQSTRVYNFAGAALDWNSQGGSKEYWQASSIIQLYNQQLRGTALVRQNNIAVIKCMNHTIFGYPLALNVTYDQSSDKFASFGLQWLVTKHLLGAPGIVSESQLEANSSPQARAGLNQLLKDQLARIDEAVSFVHSHINLTEETYPNN